MNSNPRDSSIEASIDYAIYRKGFVEVVTHCKKFLENKEEHLRAYSPEDKDERAALRLTIKDLENAIANYLKS